MSIRFAAIGFSVLAGVAMANAQDAKPARMAAVDASGRILPLAGDSTDRRHIGWHFALPERQGDGGG